MVEFKISTRTKDCIADQVGKFIKIKELPFFYTEYNDGFLFTDGETGGQIDKFKTVEDGVKRIISLIESGEYNKVITPFKEMLISRGISLPLNHNDEKKYDYEAKTYDLKWDIEIAETYIKEVIQDLEELKRDNELPSDNPQTIRLNHLLNELNSL